MGLPPHSLVRTPREDRGRQPWDAYMELLAQIVEVTSVGVAGMRLKKPIKVPRPKRHRRRRPAMEAGPQQVVLVQAEHGNPYSAAINKLTAIPAPQRHLALVDGTAGNGEQETA